MIVQGTGSAAATSVTMPAHQKGDLLLLFARAASNSVPATPTAGGTVPNWTATQIAGANTLSLQFAHFVATAANHTTGVWTGASHICVLVLRPDIGKALRMFIVTSGNGNNTQTIIYPAVPINRTDGTSWGVRCGTRGVAVTAVGTAPTNWTNRIIQPAGVSALMSVHTRAGLVANPVADTVATAGTNAPYRAHSLEITERPAMQLGTIA